jgi:LmbE family N-acetylglucosaminyl deacetylase
VNVADADAALAIRRAESRRGAAVLGAARVEFFAFKSYYLHTPDLRQVFPAFRSRAETEAWAAEVSWYGMPPVQNAYRFPECVERFTSLIAEEKPDLIITHTPNDRHPDHYAVGRFVDLVVNDLNAAGAGLKLLLREPGGGGPMGGWRPNVLVELSEADVETNQRALDCFPSQHPAGIHGFALARAVQYGRLGGVRYAQGFAWGSGAWGGSWGEEAGFKEGLALAEAPFEIIRLD